VNIVLRKTSSGMQVEEAVLPDIPQEIKTVLAEEG
jgi:hypothetical protein